MGIQTCELVADIPLHEQNVTLGRFDSGLAFITSPPPISPLQRAAIHFALAELEQR
jgi:hypothetical protein